MLYIIDEESVLTKEYEQLAEITIEKALKFLKFEYPYEVNLTMVDSEEIHSLNRDYRQVDKVTDVLSFPMIEFIVPCDYKILKENYMEFINPENNNVMLGDIVLNMDRVIEQAKEYGHSLEREFSFLILHSILHLLGYDHIQEDDEKIMIEMQKRIITQIKEV